MKKISILLTLLIGILENITKHCHFKCNKINISHRNSELTPVKHTELVLVIIKNKMQNFNLY